MKLRSISALVILLVITFSVVTIANLTPTTNAQTLPMSTTINVSTSNSVVQVRFDSAQMTLLYPQTYQFGVSAKTANGLWITQLNWYYGDGSSLSLPYCCESQVSYVSNHGYTQSGTYTVTVYAYDSAGNYGSANITINWSVPAYAGF